MNTTKRFAALFAAATAVTAVMGPSAKAGQTGPIPFTVSTTAATACTVTTGGTFQFPTYTSGQAAAVNGSMAVDITCPTSSPSGPMPVTLQFKPVLTGTAAGFEMSQGAAGAAPFLTYELCDTSCSTGTVYGNGTAGPSISITSGGVAQSYTLFGRIAGGQTPTASATAYQQVVDGYLNY